MDNVGNAHERSICEAEEFVRWCQVRRASCGAERASRYLRLNHVHDASSSGGPHPRIGDSERRNRDDEVVEGGRASWRHSHRQSDRMREGVGDHAATVLSDRDGRTRHRDKGHLVVSRVRLHGSRTWARKHRQEGASLVTCEREHGLHARPAGCPEHPVRREAGRGQPQDRGAVRDESQRLDPASRAPENWLHWGCIIM